MRRIKNKICNLCDRYLSNATRLDQGGFEENLTRSEYYPFFVKDVEAYQQHEVTRPQNRFLRITHQQLHKEI